MTQQMTPSAGAALSAANEYNALLCQVDNLTDQLSAAIHESKIDFVNALLESRASLFKQVTVASDKLTQLLSQLDMSDLSDPSDLSDVMNNCKQLLDVVTQKQAACESALMAQMQECKSELSAIGNHKGLKSAYQSSKASTDQSSYLDNRL